jgi:hypothetical protein
MARRAATDLNVIAARRLETELIVKRRHAVDLAGGESEMAADLKDRLSREEAIDPLDLLE